MSIEVEVLRLAREILEDQTVHLKSERSSISSWDSLRHAELLIAVEERFSVTFTPSELASVDSVENLTQLLVEHGIPRV